MQRRIGALGAVALFLTLLAVPAAQARQKETAHPGKYRGIVFAKANSVSRTTNNLTYHGGPVEHTNTVYSFYWYPSGTTLPTTTYADTLDQFFTDVAHDSGLTSNVYDAGTQYSDGMGNVTYKSTFAGRIVDTDAFPASGCSDSVTPGKCVTDAQIQSELSSYVTSHGLPKGGSTEYFVFTPKGVGSCFSGNQCSFTYYCAYHSNLGSGSSEILYANMPYANTDPSACGPGESPNGDDADATINVTSHEHNETITDPLGTAWYDRSGNEDGDKCAWNFGAASGPAGAQYNQTINGHHYYLQQEWSNHRSGCVLTGI